MVVASAQRPSPARTGTVHCVSMPHDPACVAAVRRLLLDDLRRRPQALLVADEAAVVVSELLGNAVRHAVPPPEGEVLLRWWLRPGEVWVEVVDGGGRGTPSPHHGGRHPDEHPVDPGPMATSGRGLCIVDVLASRWGTWADDAGHHAVWASLDTSPVDLERTA